MTADRRDPTNPFAPTERPGWMDSSPINRRAALLHVGFAEGNYVCRCTDCGLQFKGDKRAYRCRPCAEAEATIALQNHGQDAKPSEETTRAALAEKVLGCFPDDAPAEERHARIAIALIRAEVLEEAARVAETLSGSVRQGNITDALYIPPTAKDAAATIRALKGKS